jgi:hypothetical protein
MALPPVFEENGAAGDRRLTRRGVEVGGTKWDGSGTDHAAPVEQRRS